MPDSAHLVVAQTAPMTPSVHISIVLKVPGNRDGRFMNQHTLFQRFGLELHPRVTISINELDRPADLVVVFNDLVEPIEVIAPRNRIVKACHEMYGCSPDLCADYERVYTTNDALFDERHVFEPMLAQYYIDKPVTFLLEQTPVKTRDEVAFVYSSPQPLRSSLSDLPFVTTLTGKRKVCKWEFCQDKKYYLSVENQSRPHYLTEKLSDGLLLGCYVFYHGCPNASRFFDPNCFTDITGLSVPEIGACIRSHLETDVYGQRAELIEAERRRLLKERTFVARCLRFIEEHPAQEMARVKLWI